MTKKSLVKIILGVIIILILGAGIPLAARIWDPIWNPFRPSPEKVIEGMVKAMTEAKTSHLDLEIKMSAENKIKYDIVIATSLDLDDTDSQNPKSAGNLNTAVALDGIQVSVAGETKAIGADSYFKFTIFPTIPLIDLTKLKDQWIKTEGKKEQLEKQKEIDGKLKDLIENKKIYSLKKELADEKIEKIDTYHYVVSLDQQEIKNMMPEFLQAYGMQDGILPVGELGEDINKFLEKIAGLNTELWIGKKDLLLYRFKGEHLFDMNEIIKDEKGTASVRIDINFSKFNQPVKIEPPAEYKSFEEIFGFSSSGSLLMEDQIRAKDTRIISVMSQIRGTAELYLYDQTPQSYTNLCTYSDVIILRGDIIAQGGKDYSCNVQTGAEAGKSYCVEVQLNSGNWWCVDSALRSQQYNSNSACTTCVGKTCKCE